MELVYVDYGLKDYIFKMKDLRTSARHAREVVRTKKEECRAQRGTPLFL